MSEYTSNRRRALLLLIKIRIKKFWLIIPVLFPLLLYFVEMLGELKVYFRRQKNGKIHRMLTAIDQFGILLEKLRYESPLDLVDVEAEDKKDGKVLVKIALW